MSSINSFYELFLDVWQSGIFGINASQIIIGFIIFLIFYVLRRLFARFVIGRLNKIYIELSKMKYNYKRVKLKNGKTFYRLFVGEFSSKEAAKDFCKLVLKKNTCIIKYYD